jgi:FMN phosphatase YigB (HAD superfamily)
VSRARYRTLLLDLDGTLLDVEMRGFLEAFFPLAAARFGGQIGRAHV